MLTLYILSHCEYCAWLIRELSIANIDYTTVDAEDNDRAMTKLEDSLGTALYPIVRLTNEAGTIFYISRQTFKPKTAEQLNIKIYNSIQHLVQLIKLDL